jgi:hypothetical protein
MRRVAQSPIVLWGLAISMTLVLVSCAGTKSTCKQSGDGWVEIFNGKDLTGWEVMGRAKDSFYAEDGVLVCAGKRADWIRYTEELDNFVLRVDYKVTKGANSGVFLRSRIKGHPAYTGFEIQIFDDYGLRPDTHASGAVYDVVTPTENTSKPMGEWNQFEITCDGPKVIVVHNGTKIIDINLDEFTEPIGKFKTPYAKLPRKGYIGLQDHGYPLWFRNISVKKL